MTKKELRKIYKEKRINISPKEKNILDDLLLIQFQKIALPLIRNVFSYIPLEDRNEPNTDLFVSYLQAMIPSIHITYPATNFETGEMEALLVHDETEYHQHPKGMIEPKHGEIITPDSVDLVIVPLLAFDTNGYRVGYGKGFYDKYLNRCRKDILKIGFSYFEPIDIIEDTDSFDVPLTHCITPKHIYEF